MRPFLEIMPFGLNIHPNEDLSAMAYRGCWMATLRRAAFGLCSTVYMGGMTMKKQTLVVVCLAFVLLVMTSVAVAGDEHVQAPLQPVNGSGVSGMVNVVGLPHEHGAHINVNAFGLQAGEAYVSLYYENHTCELEPYSASDVIGGPYTGNVGGH